MLLKTYVIFTEVVQAGVLMKQTSFFLKPKLESGGSLYGKGKLKGARTLDSRRPMHLVLKSKQPISLFKNKHALRSVLKKQAKTFGIKIYSHSIQKDHWHYCTPIGERALATLSLFAHCQLGA